MINFCFQTLFKNGNHLTWIKHSKGRQRIPEEGKERKREREIVTWILFSIDRFKHKWKEKIERKYFRES